MNRLLKYRNIYVFIVVLAMIGFISGLFYYKFLPDDSKTSVIEKYEFESLKNKRINNISKRIKEHGITFVSSVLVIPLVLNVINIFYKPFQIGFVFNILNEYVKVKFLYMFLYYIIPLIYNLILIKISFTISKRVIYCLIYRNERKYKKSLKNILIKYLILCLISIIYEIFIYLFSLSINNFIFY